MWDRISDADSGPGIVEGGVKVLLVLSLISRELLILALTLPVALGVGFALGVLYERWYQAAQLQRLSKRFERLFEHAVGVLDRAEKACALLNERLSGRTLTETQQSHLQSLSTRLMGRLSQLTGHSSPQRTIKSVLPRVKRRSRGPFQQPHWQRSSLDVRTGYPDAIAYEQNLQSLLRAIQGRETQCGVLFVQVDQYHNHLRRSGATVADDFVRQTGSQVLRQLRETDFLAQVSEDLLVAMLADLSREELEALAQGARKAIRNYSFVNCETEQPVFVTASFGFTLFDAELKKSPHPAQELWQRGQQALQASQKHGRCQLHEITPAGVSRLIAG